MVSDPVSWFLRYLSPLVIQSGLLAVILGLVTIRLVRSIPVVSWVFCSILSPKLAPNPSLIKWIILLLKTFNVLQLYIKSNILYKLAIADFPCYLSYASPIVTGAVVTHVILRITNIYYSFLAIPFLWCPQSLQYSDLISPYWVSAQSSGSTWVYQVC